MVGAAEDVTGTGAGAGAGVGAGDAGFAVNAGGTACLIGETTVGFGAGVVFCTVVILVDATREMRTDSKSLAKLSSGSSHLHRGLQRHGLNFALNRTLGHGNGGFGWFNLLG